jgi:pimeloyl-ACP methyl ester carboxylesterase
MRVVQQARDAASIINTMGFDKAIVVGRSGGAIIGLELAANSRRRVGCEQRQISGVCH